MEAGVQTPVKLSGGTPDLTVRYLENDKETLLFCINYSANLAAEVNFLEEHEAITELSKTGELEVQQCKVSIQPYGWKVICIKKA